MGGEKATGTADEGDAGRGGGGYQQSPLPQRCKICWQSSPQITLFSVTHKQPPDNRH